MINILHIMGCADLGGISAVVKNYYQFIDRTQVHFDIALTVPAGKNARFLESMGCKLYSLPLKSLDPQGFRTGLQKILTEGNYDGLHVHENETSFVALKIAKELGIPCRIAHAHETAMFYNIKGEVKRLAGCVFNYHYASHVLACGKMSGNRIYGKINMKRPKALVMPNAVDTEAFAFDPEVRSQVRKELGLKPEGQLVLGMVNRLNKDKNIPFSLRLLKELLKIRPDAVLVIVGDGEEREMLQNLAKELELGSSLKMLGARTDVARFYQAFDVLLMPSVDEGFPVVPVEGMSSGLPVLISDMVTDELNFGTGVTYLSLKEMKPWVDGVLRWEQDPGRAGRQHEVADHDLDIHKAAQKLLKIYKQDTGK